MKTIYLVVHYFDEDGGFGDAIGSKETIAAFENREDAETFVLRFGSNPPRIYDRPYDDLTCGDLRIDEFSVYGKGECNLDEVDTENFWWLGLES